jgi:mannose-6-phosphate isomerase-like protein (cupin superfamily)
VKSDRYEVVHLDELETISLEAGEPILRPVRRRLGFEVAGVNCWTVGAAGDTVIERHSEKQLGHEELYVVLAGSAAFTVGDDEFDAPTGTLVFVPPGTERTAVATDAHTTVLAVGARAGEAFQPSGWEDFVVAEGYRRQGEVGRGRAAIAEALAREPDAWQGAYNAACFESLAGDAGAALAHLRRAVELNPEEVRAYAATDTDLDPVRSDPRFEEALA